MPVAGATIHLTVRCQLRPRRGTRTLAELQQLTGIHRGTLSQLERGERLPRPSQVGALEAAYGPQAGWYTVHITADEAP